MTRIKLLLILDFSHPIQNLTHPSERTEMTTHPTVLFRPHGAQITMRDATPNLPDRHSAGFPRH